MLILFVPRPVDVPAPAADPPAHQHRGPVRGHQVRGQSWANQPNWRHEQYWRTGDHSGCDQFCQIGNLCCNFPVMIEHQDDHLKVLMVHSSLLLSKYQDEIR